MHSCLAHVIIILLINSPNGEEIEARQNCAPIDIFGGVFCVPYAAYFFVLGIHFLCLLPEKWVFNDGQSLGLLASDGRPLLDFVYPSNHFAAYILIANACIVVASRLLDRRRGRIVQSSKEKPK